MTLAERTIRTQRETLKKANNMKFECNGNEYRLRYEGGVAEYISIHCHKKNRQEYKCVGGFDGYTMYSVAEVVDKAKAMVENT